MPSTFLLNICSWNHCNTLMQRMFIFSFYGFSSNSLLVFRYTRFFIYDSKAHFITPPKTTIADLDFTKY